MRIFQHSQGFLVAFGFDMINRRPAPRRISWNDPTTGEWESKASNAAGWNDLSFTINPEFIREQGGRIIAYQPGKCIEMTLIGGAMIWSFSVLQSDTQPIAEVA